MTFGGEPFGTQPFGALGEARICEGDLAQSLRQVVRTLHGYAASQEKLARAFQKDLEVHHANLEAISLLIKLGKIEEAKELLKVGLDGWPDIPPSTSRSPLQPVWAYLGGSS